MDAIKTKEEEELKEIKTKPNIAGRTRSHLRIEDFVPNDNLDFPDVDMNLYHNPESECDTVYKNFLNQIYSVELGSETNNNDDNDPEYVYNDDIFSHGWRYDLNEINHDESDRLLHTGDPSISAHLEGQHGLSDLSLATLTASEPDLVKSPVKAVKSKIDMFNEPEFKRVLNQQLRQHIQLLTQAYLLTKNTTNMRSEAEEAKNHLCSYIKVFKNKAKPSNLLPALDLVNNTAIPKDLKSSIRLSWRPLPIPETVKNTIHDNPNVFIYPSLLPQVAFSILPEKLTPKKPKINFTINEDKLLAYALNEFKGESSQYAFIASLLMVAKTKTQISNHIKNIKRSPGNEDNPIKLYYASGELPEINIDSDSSLVQPAQERRLSATSDNEKENSVENDSESVIERQIGTDIDRSDVALDPKVIDNPEKEHPEEAVEFTAEKQLEEVKKETQEEPEVNTSELFTIEAPAELDQVVDEIVEEPPNPISNESGHNEPPETDDPPEANDSSTYKDQDCLMNMDLDDLMAASITISKSSILNVGTNSENKNMKNRKLKRSMLNLMSHNFLLSHDMGDLIIFDFLKAAQEKLSERNNYHLLQLLTDLFKRRSKNNDGDDETVVTIYHEISRFLQKIDAPPELHERVALFLDLNQASKCDCSLTYLHWMRFFEFMQHVELHHDSVEAFEKKLIRLVDALQKDDPHKTKLAIGNLVNKHPFLKREFESLSMDEKPHASLFICQEDFDDITEPLGAFESSTSTPGRRQDDEESRKTYYDFENLQSKATKEELSYASQTCPCKCHTESVADGHCGRCDLKFMRGRMYLVNKIKPILAEWSHVANPTPPALTATSTLTTTNSNVALNSNVGSITASPSTTNTTQQQQQQQQLASPTCSVSPINKTNLSNGLKRGIIGIEWTFEDDREILEFCRLKAEQNDETISFDTSTFEELVANKSHNRSGQRKKTAKEVAERFNQLMDLYNNKNGNSDSQTANNNNNSNSDSIAVISCRQK